MAVGGTQLGAIKSLPVTFTVNNSSSAPSSQGTLNPSTIEGFYLAKIGITLTGPNVYAVVVTTGTHTDNGDYNIEDYISNMVLVLEGGIQIPLTQNQYDEWACSDDEYVNVAKAYLQANLGQSITVNINYRYTGSSSSGSTGGNEDDNEGGETVSTINRQDIVLYDIDTEGNTKLLFPVTRVENVEDAITDISVTTDGKLRVTKKKGDTTTNTDLTISSSSGSESFSDLTIDNNITYSRDSTLIVSGSTSSVKIPNRNFQNIEINTTFTGSTLTLNLSSLTSSLSVEKTVIYPNILIRNQSLNRVLINFTPTTNTTYTVTGDNYIYPSSVEDRCYISLTITTNNSLSSYTTYAVFTHKDLSPIVSMAAGTTNGSISYGTFTNGAIGTKTIQVTPDTIVTDMDVEMANKLTIFYREPGKNDTMKYIDITPRGFLQEVSDTYTSGSSVWIKTTGTDSLGNTEEKTINLGTYLVDKVNAQTIAGSKTFSGTVTLSRTTDAAGATSNLPCLLVGGTESQQHLEMDGNEIMSKSNATTVSTLYLNADGGNVQIGSPSSTLDVKGILLIEGYEKYTLGTSATITKPVTKLTVSANTTLNFSSAVSATGTYSQIFTVYIISSGSYTLTLSGLPSTVHYMNDSKSDLAIASPGIVLSVLLANGAAAVSVSKLST